ncbi:NADPH-dependent FMN reductase [Limimonas halophila]|uniref:NADPH-dependent FMN reductase n=1 Tax=Limimonas halophila TaxID=1082479 RepID=A0A1G7RAE2_9PROT|nr:NAD(P)H-dependent oxidoreductase [Limimonas halophila]SDG07605.1 NADPH-dependent FMN reductase [Limimonas halophila]
MPAKRLLIVAHAPSPNTQRLLDAVVRGAQSADIESVEVVAKRPFDADAEDVRAADAVILGTPENLGYMSGALKDFFDRIFYAVGEDTEALPYAAYIRAGKDGTGTYNAIRSITTGLRWRPIQEPMILHGEWQEAFVGQCEELGTLVATGLDMGIY